MNSLSLRQNNLTKTIAQISDFLFIYVKFKAMDHAAFQHISPISVDAKNDSFVHMAYCITDHFSDILQSIYLGMLENKVLRTWDAFK